MDFAAFLGCISAASCVVSQVTNGLIIGMLLFLVASGLTLIFGVLKVVNFAHGSLYMLGAYFALVTYKASGSYAIAALAAVAGVAIFGVILERLFISRVYNQEFLMQLLMCYGWVLVLDDAVKLIFGAEFQSMGMPPTFAVAPVFIAGTPVPPFYMFLIGTAFVIALCVWLLIEKTSYGKKVRAAAVNPAMTGALGVNTTMLQVSVFALGAALAGMAGGLAAPVRSLVPGMGLSILIESFIVTVIGGMGSIWGALFASILIGLTRAFGSYAFPLFTEGLVFVLMAVVLIVRPAGLFGKEEGR